MTLRKQNEVLKGYLAKVVGPLDPEHLEETLNATLERRDGGGVHLNRFLKSCQQWQKSFEEKSVLIIRGNIKLLHATQKKCRQNGSNFEARFQYYG